MEVMKVCSYSRLLAPTAKEKHLLGPNSWWRDKMLLDSGRRASPKGLEAYIDEVVWLNPPEAEQHDLHGH